MKKIHILPFFLFAGIAGSFAQSGTTEDPLPLRVSQDKEKVNVIYSSDELSAIEISLKDESGKIIYSENVQEKKLRHEKTIDLRSYNKGVYFIQVDCERMQEVDRIEL